MKAFVLEKYKASELSLTQCPAPSVGTHEVLVRIHAAGLNVLDIKIRDGDLKAVLPYKTPFIPGHDMAGVIEKAGTGVQKFRVGDEVYARVADGRIGTFAEYIAVRESDLANKPANLSMADAAGVPLVALTAWQALVEIARVEQGQKVFVQAGSGGVGTVAIQLAKHLGAKVATTCSSRNLQMVRELGADVVIDYKAEKFEDTLSGYDVVLHSRGEDELEKSLRILRRGGTLVSISGPPTPEYAREQGLNAVTRIILTLLSHKARKLANKQGVHYRFLSMHADGSQLAQITGLIESGVIQPVTDRSYPFAELNDAMAYLDKGHAKGKVVVEML